MPCNLLSLSVLGTLLALAACGSVAVPYDADGSMGGESVAVLDSEMTSPSAEGESSGRYKILDRAMEIHVGTQLFAEFDTVMRFDSPLLGLGAPIDFESDLGFDDRARILRLDLKYRLGMRHRLEFSYFDIQRRANWTLQKDIQIGDKIFPVNINVDVVLGTTILKSTYRYLFLLGDNWDVSASAGLHTFGIGLSVEENAADQRADQNFTLPLPVVGLGANYAVSKRLRLSTTWELFGIELKQFKGYLVDARVNLDWDIWEKVGIGIGWNGFVTEIEVVDKYLGGDLLTGTFRYKYHGLMIYLRLFL